MNTYLIVGLLVAFSAMSLLIFFRIQASKSNKNFDLLSKTQKKWTQGQLELDQQTRFVETPKRKQYRLLNDSEQELYQRLQEAMPNMQVFAQVGVAQLALLRGRQEARRLAQMAGRGVDFVICDNEFAIIAAIELSWPNNEEDINAAEAEKHSALKSLGIPLIVFRPNSLPDADAISREIADAIIRRNRLESERH